MTTSEKLREKRVQKGMTQVELAVASGLSVATVTKLEQGSIVDPAWSTVQALARALGCTTDDLRGDA